MDGGAWRAKVRGVPQSQMCWATEHREAGAGLGLVTSHCPVSDPGLLAVRRADGAGTRSPRNHPGGAGIAHLKPEGRVEVQGCLEEQGRQGNQAALLRIPFSNYQPHQRRREEQV